MSSVSERPLAGLFADPFMTEQISGINLITYYAPVIYHNLGIGDFTSRLLAALNGTEYFLFDPTVTSIPAMELTCDTANNGKDYKESCTTFLYLRIPGTERTVVENKVQLDYPVSAACDETSLNV